MTDASMIPTVESVAVSARELKAKAFAVSKRVGWVGGLVAAWYSFGSLLAALATLGVVLASVRVSGFLRWARTRRHDLRAAGRPSPSLRELLAVRRSEQKRLAALVANWPSRCTENGIKLAGRAPMLVDHTIDLDGNVTAKLIRTGFDPDDIKAKAGKLAKGLGCPEIVVRETSPGAADVSFLWTDPLGKVLPLADLPLSAPGKIAFGVTASGEPATLEADLSTIFAGVTRSGKSNAAEAALADLVRKGEPVRLYVSNPKLNELSALKDLVGKPRGCVEIREYAETEAENTKMIANFENSMRVRSSHMNGRKLTRPTKDNPRSILWLDEMFLLPTDTYKKGPFSPLGRILAAGGASLHTVFGCTQLLYSADLGSIKGLFSQRVAFRTTSAPITDTILGEGATNRGARCHTLHKKRDRGVGYAADQEEDLTKFRAAHVTDADLWRIIRGIVPEGMRTEPDPEPERVLTDRERLTNVLIGLRWRLVFVLALVRRRARGIVPAFRRLSVGARLSYLVRAVRITSTRALIASRTRVAGVLSWLRRGALDLLATLGRCASVLRFLAAYQLRAVRIRSTEPRAAVLAFLGRRAARAALSGAVFLQLMIGMAR